MARDDAYRIGERLDERGGAAGLPRPSVVVVTGNRRCQLSVKRAGPWYELRIGLHMLDAADLVVESILEELRTGHFPDQLHEFVAAIKPAAGPVKDSPKCLQDALARVLDLVPEHREGAAVEVHWSRTNGRTMRRSIRLGSAAPGGQIRIHPALKSPSVPEYVLDMVVYHELCHCFSPPMTAAEARRAGEHRIHHSKFRALEARYPRLGEANEWVRDNLNSLLRSS